MKQIRIKLLCLLVFLTTMIFSSNHSQAQNYSFVVHSNKFEISEMYKETQIVNRNVVISFDDREVILSFGETQFIFDVVTHRKSSTWMTGEEYYTYEVLDFRGEYSKFSVYPQGENKRVIYTYGRNANENATQNLLLPALGKVTYIFEIIKITDSKTNKQPLTQTEKLSKANLRNIMIRHTPLDHFSGPIKFLMSKQDFYKICSPTLQSQLTDKDDLYVEILNPSSFPSGNLWFKFNQEGKLYAFEMRAEFFSWDDKLFNLEGYFVDTLIPFFKRLMGESLTWRQFQNIVNIENPRDSDFLDSRFWVSEDIVIGAVCDEKVLSNGRTIYTLTLGIEQLKD